MAQGLNIFRASYTAPLAIGIMVVGLFLLYTRKITEGCFLFLMVLGCAVWLIPKFLDGFTELSIAQLNNSTSQHNLLAEQEKTTQLKFQAVIKFIGCVAPIVSFIVFLLRKIHFGH